MGEARGFLEYLQNIPEIDSLEKGQIYQAKGMDV